MQFEPVSAKVLHWQLFDPLQHIEVCGRTCYHSLDKLTPDSKEKFVQSLTSSGHYSVTEHCNYCFELDEKTFHDLALMAVMTDGDPIEENISDGVKSLNFTAVELADNKARFLVSGNIRAFNNALFIPALEHIKGISPLLVWADADKYDYYSRVWDDTHVYCALVPCVGMLYDVTPIELAAHTYVTFSMYTTVGTYKDLTRHRKVSYSIESTRFCNYSKDRFEGQITYANASGFSADQSRLVRRVFDVIEDTYTALAESGCDTDHMRGILPHDVMANVVMTVSVKELTHILRLRYFETTGRVNYLVKQTSSEMYKAIIDSRDMIAGEAGLDLINLLNYNKSINP